MIVINNRIDLEGYIDEKYNSGLKIGFAPTMGALHGGHLSLYETARKNNDIVISSIFVNPTQFNNTADLLKYPRTQEEDIKLLEQSNYVDAVYIPRIEDVYPNGTVSKKYNFGGLENEMEGASRPGHFDGVGTIVKELFNQIKPTNAYFGEKDFQQLAIIKKLVENENIPVSIFGVPTLREESGLALSSRNKRLTETEKTEAQILFKTLSEVKNWFNEIDVKEIKKRVHDIFNSQENMSLEYFIIADENTLKEITIIEHNKNYRAFIVVHINEVRLIDNIPLY